MGTPVLKSILTSFVKQDCFIRGEGKCRCAGKEVNRQSAFWLVSIRILVLTEFLWSDCPSPRQDLEQPIPIICSKNLLVIHGRHNKPGLCFKAYILFPDLGRSIVHYMLFNQEGHFVG